jgi:SAM-dependent methyltransferase
LIQDDNVLVRVASTALGTIHERSVLNRRVERLAQLVAPLLPNNASVLDVGAGDGLLAARIMELRPDVSVTGIDVLVRPDTRIPVLPFDGRHLPVARKSVDVVVFIDVLHHTMWPEELLDEAAGAARHAIVLKDHTRDGVLARATLSFMDWLGNARHGVALPQNYLSRAEWDIAFGRAGLIIERFFPRLHLYPWPASWLFDRGLHFIAVLRLGQNASV